MKKVLFKVHGFLLWVSFTVMVASVSIYVVEQNQTFDDYYKYWDIVSFKKNFDVGDPLMFYSFYTSRKPTDIKWHETVYCKVGDGNYNLIDTHSSGVDEIWAPQEYPDDIMGLLLRVDGKSNAGSYEDREYLRKYADNRGGLGWQLQVKPPVPNSTCYTRHLNTIYTKYFNLKKTYEFISNEWTYGADAETTIE